MQNHLLSLPSEVYRNRRLVWKLAKNDFRTRYAGSYLGIIWAFIQKQFNLTNDQMLHYFGPQPENRGT